MTDKKPEEMMRLTRRGFLSTTVSGALIGLLPNGLYAAELAKIPPLSFVQLSDTHVGGETSLIRTPLTVEKINALSLPFDFIIHTGDVSNGNGALADMQKARELFTFKKPAFYVP